MSLLHRAAGRTLRNMVKSSDTWGAWSRAAWAAEEPEPPQYGGKGKISIANQIYTYSFNTVYLTHLQWPTIMWTILIQKDPSKETLPSNYRPKTCLSTMWKLMSEIIAAKISRQVDYYMSTAQKNICEKTRGLKPQLLVDWTIPRNCKTGWWDWLQEADNSIPHTWKTERLQMYNINNFIKVNGKKPITKVSIKRGTHQDIVCLHCCSSVSIPSVKLSKLTTDRLRNEVSISHFLYMDDIKL